MRRIAAGLALALVVALAVTDIAQAQAISTLGIAASKPTPQRLSSAGTVVFAATASGGSGSYEYQFFLKTGAGPYVAVGDTTTDYSAANTWSWTPTVATSYSVRVYARNLGSAAIFEKLVYLAYSVLVDPPTTGVTLTPDKSAPQPAMTTVTFTALASGGTGTYAYRFFVAQGAGAYVPMENGGTTGYSSLNQFSWTPNKPANYKIRVNARNTTSLANFQSSKTITYLIAGVLCPDGKAIVGFLPNGSVICGAAIGPKGDKGDPGLQGAQGLPGIQGIQGEPGTPGSHVDVYDADDQFLGYWQSAERPSGGDILVPSIPAILRITTEGDFPYSDDWRIDYTELDCTGDAYIQDDGLTFFALRRKNGQYYMWDQTVLSNYPMQSLRNNAGICENVSFTMAYGKRLAKVTLPFNLPVRLPLRLITSP